MNRHDEPLKIWSDLQLMRELARSENGRANIEAARAQCEQFIEYAEKELALFVQCHATLVEALKPRG